MTRIMGLSPNQVQIVIGLAARIVMTLVVVVVSWCMEIDIMWVLYSYVSASCMYRGWVWCMGKNGQESWWGGVWPGSRAIIAVTDHWRQSFADWHVPDHTSPAIYNLSPSLFCPFLLPFFVAFSLLPHSHLFLSCPTTHPLTPQRPFTIFIIF